MSAHHKIDHYSSASLVHAVALLYMLMVPALLHAQKESPQPEAHTNSLGVKFLAVPGNTLCFAQWETRVSDFAAFVKATGYAWDYAPNFAQTGDHPVVNVTLQDAIAFCKWLTQSEREKGIISAEQSYRLPSSAEWDNASGKGKAGDEAPMFTWGNEWPPPPWAGNFNSQEINNTDDGFPFTAPVGSFAASRNGLHDLSGNVWEWTLDETPTAMGVAILRGGSWQYFRKENLASSYRYRVPQNLRKSSVGFRCVFEDSLRAKTQLAEVKRNARLQQEDQVQRLKAKTVVSDEEVALAKKEMAKQKVNIESEAAKALIESSRRNVQAKGGGAKQNTNSDQPKSTSDDGRN